MVRNFIIQLHMKCLVILFIANQPLAKIIKSPVHVKDRDIPPSTMCAFFSLLLSLCYIKNHKPQYVLNTEVKNCTLMSVEFSMGLSDKR
jgi:hypothetical protein